MLQRIGTPAFVPVLQFSSALVSSHTLCSVCEEWGSERCVIVQEFLVMAGRFLLSAVSYARSSRSGGWSGSAANVGPSAPLQVTVGHHLLSPYEVGRVALPAVTRVHFHTQVTG